MLLQDTFTHVHTYIHIHIYTSFVLSRLDEDALFDVAGNIYIRTHMHTYTHTHIYTYTPVLFSPDSMKMHYLV